MVTPLSDAMCRIQRVPFGSMMFTFMAGHHSRSIPINLEQPWDLGYFKSHVHWPDTYTSVALHNLMIYVADDILTDRINSILEEANEDN
jgi:hypothetical protein